MPNKTVKTGNPDRRPDGTFAPGNNANPNGRPKGISITEMVKEALEEVEDKTGQQWKDLIVKRILLKSVNEGDTQMLKAVWSYIDGMPKQSTDITSGGDKISLAVMDYTTEDAD